MWLVPLLRPKSSLRSTKDKSEFVLRSPHRNAILATAVTDRERERISSLSLESWPQETKNNKKKKKKNNNNNNNFSVLRTAMRCSRLKSLKTTGDTTAWRSELDCSGHTRVSPLRKFCILLLPYQQECKDVKICSNTLVKQYSRKYVN